MRKMSVSKIKFLHASHECNSREIYTVSLNSCFSHTYKFTTNTAMEIFMSNKKLIFSCVKLTSRFLIALHLFGNETQMMSKCSSFHQVESTLRVSYMMFYTLLLKKSNYFLRSSDVRSKPVMTH